MRMQRWVIGAVLGLLLLGTVGFVVLKITKNTLTFTVTEVNR